MKSEGVGGSFKGDGANRSFRGEADLPVLRFVGRGGILGTPAFDAVKLFGEREGRGGIAGGFFADIVEARQRVDDIKRKQEVKKRKVKLLCVSVTAQRPSLKYASAIHECSFSTTICSRYISAIHYCPLL